MATDTYILINEQTGECIVTDPAACPAEFLRYFQTEGLKVSAVLLTHGHFDHIMGLDEFCKEYPAPVYAHEDEKSILLDPQRNLSGLVGKQYSYSGAEYLRDGEELELAGMKLRVIHTPGHTAGGCCYYFYEEDVLISGDTLFNTSIGRTDFPTGSSSQLVRSVKEKLFVLPEETKVYPGHMEETTIGYEKKNNPYV